ncbi:MAG: divalent-cation tolerance protein CutA [Rhodospirillales bacterium]|jgi:periplasmic divalent cation tolerance protein|nr:divalent-cation tolerance protein CutA [Rhodospirillales bacterium]
MAEVLVYVTAASRDHALLIGRQLVEERLAACVNVLGPIASIYRWEGEVCEDEEVAFIAKTRAELVPALSERVHDLHDYDTPCIVAVEIAGGNPEFLSWIGEQCLDPAAIPAEQDAEQPEPRA